jgi:hypothetical protein
VRQGLQGKATSFTDRELRTRQGFVAAAVARADGVRAARLGC